MVGVVAELTERIESPAVCEVGCGHTAGVPAARTHLAEAQSAGDRDRRPTPTFRGAVAKLAEDIVSPAVGPIAGRHAAGVRTVEATAELAEGVLAPAVGPVVGGHAAGVGGARAHLAEAERPGDRDGCQAFGGRAVAEHAAIAAPAVRLIVRGHAAGVT